MTDMMLKLNKIDGPSSNPHLLCLPSTILTAPFQPLFQPLRLLSSSTQQNLLLPLIPLIRLMRLEIPLITGDDVLGWLLQINHFFVFHTIVEDQKFFITVFYISDVA